MTHSVYNKQDLIDHVKSQIENVRVFFEDDLDVLEVDIRLQLVDGTYYFHSGDSQFDDDHRGAWGYGCIDVTEEYSDDDLSFIAEEIVNEALEDFEVQQQEVTQI